ncbi:MAG: hypothetical protein JOZ62_07780 [Acidobacteriaceae bacterium]|nr:hypothetical protein [Acidobacteriaceae bacterium]
MKFLVLLVCLCGVPLAAADKWLAKDPAQWTPEEIDRVLSDSAWARQTTAILPSTDEDPRTYPVPLPTPHDAGLAGGVSSTSGSSDGHWDGGVGRLPRDGTPTLPVTVRWDSALPIRQALRIRGSEAPSEKDYVIAVLGMVPAHQPLTAGMRQGLINQARLMARGKKAIVPEDVEIDDGTGAVRIFFSRTEPITSNDKEVTFGTTFGSMKVIQKFRLKEMMYRGKLEL